MKKCVVASVMVFGLSTAVWAATEDKWFVTKDTVGNCSVSQGKPSEGQAAQGETGGYASAEEARKHLDSVRDQCAGVVE